MELAVLKEIEVGRLAAAAQIVRRKANEHAGEAMAVVVRQLARIVSLRE